MKQFLCYALFVLCISFGYGNSNPDLNEKIGSIQGVVYDKSLQMPLPYVTISVENNAGEIVTGSITDDNGTFEIKGVPAGTYAVKIQYIGFKPYQKEVTINRENRNYDLGKIELEEDVAALDEVTVVAERSTIVQKVDRKVITVGKDLTTVGPSASDIMNNIPSVNVDQDGNIALRGNQNVRVLVDGRPTNISPAQLLQQIPSSSIKQIELITNPSAKYNPEGMSGIINIILHKNTNNGFNGDLTVGLTKGENARFNSNINLNYRQGKFNFYGTYGTFAGKFSNDGRMRRFDNPDTPGFDESSTETFGLINNRTSHLLKFGVDYFINDNNTLSAYTTKNFFDSDMNSLVHLTLLNDPGTTVTQESLFYTENNGTVYNVAYKHKFAKEGHEILLEGDFNTLDNDENSFFKYPSGNGSYYNDMVVNNRENTTVNLDYINPLNETMKLELGAEARLQKTENDYATTSNELIPANFYYNRDILSAYATFGQNFEKWSYQVGARVENYQVDAEFSLEGQDPIPFEDEILTVYPSAFLSYNFNEKNTSQLSYSRRVDRPGLEQINPIREFSTPQLTSIGNQQLEPQFTSSIELNHTKQLEKGSITGGVFYRFIKDEINRTVEIDPLNPTRLILSYDNFEDNNAYGVEVSGAYRPTKWWNVNASFDLYQQTLKGVVGTEYTEVDNTSYTFRMSNSFKATKNLTLQAFGFYRGPVKSLQFNVQEFYFVNAGFRYNTLQGKATISFNYNDVFNTQRSLIDTENPMPMTGRFKWESQTWYVGLSYRFGGGKSKTLRRKQRDDNEASGGGNGIF